MTIYKLFRLSFNSNKSFPLFRGLVELQVAFSILFEAE